MKYLVFLILLAITCDCLAARVDTVSIYSKAMKKEFRCVVITPESSTKKKFPVVYLLHGYSGSFRNWIQRVPQLKEYADEYELMIVCPDGGHNSWYLDSPL